MRRPNIPRPPGLPLPPSHLLPPLANSATGSILQQVLLLPPVLPLSLQGLPMPSGLPLSQTLPLPPGHLLPLGLHVPSGHLLPPSHLQSSFNLFMPRVIKTLAHTKSFASIVPSLWSHLPPPFRSSILSASLSSSLSRLN